MPNVRLLEILTPTVRGGCVFKRALNVLTTTRMLFYLYCSQRTTGVWMSVRVKADGVEIFPLFLFRVQCPAARSTRGCVRVYNRTNFYPFTCCRPSHMDIISLSLVRVGCV